MSQAKAASYTGNHPDVLFCLGGVAEGPYTEYPSHSVTLANRTLMEKENAGWREIPRPSPSQSCHAYSL